jgi:hypothetical protein
MTLMFELVPYLLEPRRVEFSSLAAFGTQLFGGSPRGVFTVVTVVVVIVPMIGVTITGQNVWGLLATETRIVGVSGIHAWEGGVAHVHRVQNGGQMMHVLPFGALKVIC